MARTSTLLAVLALTSATCKLVGGDDNGTLLDPNNPPPGLNTSQAQLTDGAGHAGPIRARLITLSPPLNAQVLADNFASCNKSSPYNCFEFQAELCMDDVPNPTNSSRLAGMQIEALFSADGVSPILQGGNPIDLEPLTANTVAKGACAALPHAGRRVRRRIVHPPRQFQYGGVPHPRRHLGGPSRAGAHQLLVPPGV